MKKLCWLGVLLGLSMFISGCAATQYRDAATKIQTANPHAALEYVALAIQQKPDDPETRRMLDGLIKTISRDHEARIELMRREQSYDEAVVECDRVIASAHLVSSLPGGNAVLFHEERERAELAELAAGKSYQLALDYEAQNRPREAVDAYCQALGFRAAYKDAEQRRMSVMDSTTTKLFVTSAASRDEEASQQLLAAITPAALASRPRFLKVIRDETNATSKCTVCIESVTMDDSEWVGTSLKKDTEAFEVTNQKTGKVTYYPARHVDGMLYTRTLVCTVSGNFSVTPIRATDPQPAGTASVQATDSRQYAVWQGDKELLPSGVATLPQQPPELRSASILKIDCVRRLAANLGEQLFLAYK